MNGARPDLELLARLHVYQRWTVTAGAFSWPASSLALALRLANTRNGERPMIASARGDVRIDYPQVRRLIEAAARR